MATVAVDPPDFLIDTHCHLTWPSFGDVSEVLARARAAGVCRLLTAATDLPSCRAALALAGTYEEVFAAVGIHPNDLRPDDDVDAICALAQHERVVAIGETGLDYYRDYVPAVLQRRAFDAHLALAATLNLPVVVHNRQADQDVLSAITAFQGRVRGVLHCFSGDRALAARALDLGYYLSFAGNLTYPSAAALRDVAAWVPRDRVLVETDAPFLSPVPRRGKRNEPAFVGLTLQALAACRMEDARDLAQQVISNAQTLFAW
ncbi:MAG TPA: TatD family hydrolase [Chloroflexota bacterium]|nr:TatD family hydrolase [Chloroflexota bacterium]